MQSGQHEILAALNLAAGDTLDIALRTLPIIGTTLVLVEILNAHGILRRFQGPFQAVVRLARLPAESGLALVTAIGSALSADTMIAAHYRSGRMNAAQTLVSAQVNTLPGYFLESCTYIAPIIVPALGRTPGLYYLAAFIWAGLFRGGLVVLAGRWVHRSLPSASRETVRGGVPAANPQIPDKPEYGTVLRKAWKLFFRIARLLLVVSFLMALALHSGVLAGLTRGLRPVVAWFGLPEALIVPVLGYAASPMVAASAVGALYKTHAVTGYAATLGALTGGLLAMPIFALRYSIARHISVFGVRLGCINALLSLAIGMTARLLAILALPLLWKGWSG